MSSLIDSLELYEDEMILMIAKGNEEALRLLFSLYETKLRFESNFFGNKFNLPTFDKEDLYQEIKITLYEAVLKYDYRQGKFYSFWNVMMKRSIFAYLKKECLPSQDSRRHEQFDETKKYCDLEFNDYTKYDYELSFLNVSIKNNDLFFDCLKLWMEGYSYKEISDMQNMSIASVNYHIRKALSTLRDKLKND